MVGEAAVELAGARVTVMGLARSGVAACRLLQAAGAGVTIADRKESAELTAVLGTIDRDHVQMGRTAAELILETLRGKTTEKVTLPVTFDPNESCGPVRAKSNPRSLRVR